MSTCRVWLSIVAASGQTARRDPCLQRDRNSPRSRDSFSQIDEVAKVSAIAFDALATSIGVSHVSHEYSIPYIYVTCV